MHKVNPIFYLVNLLYKKQVQITTAKRKGRILRNCRPELVIAAIREVVESALTSTHILSVYIREIRVPFFFLRERSI